MDKRELAELILVYLAECAEEAGHSYFFFSINHFAAQIEMENFDELIAALLLLEGEGLAVPSVGSFGEASAMITDAGLLHVDKGGSTGVIAEYKKDPDAFVRTRAAKKGDGTADHQKLLLGPRIYELIVNMVEAVKADARLSKGEVEDFLRDVEALNLQLGRQARNGALIDSLIAGMEHLEAIREKVAELRGLVEEYLQ